MARKGKVEWIVNVVEEIQRHIKNRKYRITTHAQERQQQYDITLPELLFVLSRGYHEKDKTLFDPMHQTWKYAIRGKTLDTLKDIRIIVAFEEEMAIITIIKLGKKRRKS